MTKMQTVKQRRRAIAGRISDLQRATELLQDQLRIAREEIVELQRTLEEMQDLPDEAQAP